jgi:hypothetical protein
MPAPKLDHALSAVDWNANVKKFLQDTPSVEKIAGANLRIAVWARQFEILDKRNPALCFIRELQIAGHNVAASSALPLYKSAAGSMREMLESALYYSYFRTHHSELATLVRNSDFYISKAELLEYHKCHTPDFSDLQKQLGLVARLNTWYKFTSSIIHGQIPGAWVQHKSLAEIKYVKATLDLVVETYCEGEELIHHLFLCTVGRLLWEFFTPSAKRLLAAGLHGDVKAALGIDSA